MQRLTEVIDGARNRYRNPWNALTMFTVGYALMVAFFAIGFMERYTLSIVFGWLYFYAITYVVAAHFSAWACPFTHSSWTTLSVILAPVTLLIVLMRWHVLPFLSIKDNEARQQAYRRYVGAGDRVFMITLFLIITAFILLALQAQA